MSQPDDYTPVLLSPAIAATGRIEDPRQTCLWFNSMPAAVADEMRRGVPA
jgi:hypothetical protein